MFVFSVVLLFGCLALWVICWIVACGLLLIDGWVIMVLQGFRRVVGLWVFVLLRVVECCFG